MNLLTDIKDSMFHFVFPHVCEGCGTDVLDVSHMLCLRCLSSLPQTAFEQHPDNPVEKMFWGRLSIIHATAQYYFTKESLMQRLMHQFKYRGNKELGLYLGKLMGHALLAAGRFTDIEGLVPLPLFKSKESKRGFNQAAVLCDGIAEIIAKPVFKDVIIRTEHTESQTKKTRLERWQNMEGRFELTNSKTIEGRHILLIDDVVTTGATLEACGSELLKALNTRLSVATLCFSTH